MKIAIYDTHKFEIPFLEKENEKFGHKLQFIEGRLTKETLALSKGAECLCCFVNDKIDSDVIKGAYENGIRLIALRSAGFNHVDLAFAKSIGMKVVHVPEYSPYAVAEHAVGMILTMNRKLHKAYNRVKEENFSLNGLVGFDIHGKTVGVIGTGKIGKIFAKIMSGFGSEILLFDKYPDEAFAKSIGARYTNLDEIYKLSDIISLHIPLTPETKYLINEASISKMKNSVMIVNTGRGKLIDTKALVRALKNGLIGFAGLDVYEEEEGVFFEDKSETGITDDCLARLLTFPNVFITAHQAFLTQEALHNIAETTLVSVKDFEQGNLLKHQVPGM